MNENHGVHNGMRHDMPKGNMQGMEHGGASMHAMHTEMFKQRFFVCIILTIPVLLLSQAIQTWLQYTITIPYQNYVLLTLATIIISMAAGPSLLDWSKS